MRTVRNFTCNNFPTNHTVVLTITSQCALIPSTYLFNNWNIAHLTTYIQFHLLLHSTCDNHESDPFFYDFVLDSIEKYLSFFYLTYFILHGALNNHLCDHKMTGLPSFLQLNNILIPLYITFSLSIYLLIDIQGVFMSGIL